jgi:hypothetical protein
MTMIMAMGRGLRRSKSSASSGGIAIAGLTCPTGNDCITHRKKGLTGSQSSPVERSMYHTLPSHVHIHTYVLAQ